MQQCSCGVAKFKENVKELYLQKRDATNTDVIFFSDLLDSLKDEVFHIVSEFVTEEAGLVVVLDVAEHNIVWHGFGVRTICLPVYLIDIHKER